MIKQDGILCFLFLSCFNRFNIAQSEDSRSEDTDTSALRDDVYRA